MAFPQPQDQVTSEEPLGTTTHGIDLPATVDAGDLLVALYGQWEGTDRGTLWPPNWEPFLWEVSDGDVRVMAAWKDADGTEGGTSITVQSIDANQSSHVVYRITGHEDPSTQPPEGRSFFGPAGYRGLVTVDDAFNSLAVSHLPVETATEDPDAYKCASSNGWAALTVAIPPAVSGTFPTLEERSHSNQTGASSTSHTVDLPGTINAGDLLIGIFGRGRSNSDDVSWPAGWTEFASVGAPGSTENRLSIAYRQADGNEGSSITVTTTDGGESTHVVYRLTGAADPGTTAPEASTANGTSASADPPSLTFSGGSDTHLWLAVADHATRCGEGLATGTSTSPDPPSLTPTGGAKDYLWLAACEARTSGGVSSAPTNYTNLQTISDFRTSIGVAERELNASSEDPGTFTLGSSVEWVAATAVIHPAAGGGGGGTTQNVTATLAGTSTDSVGSIILNLTGTTTLAGTSTTGGAITTTELIALTATLAGTSSDTAAVSLKQAITATLAGMSEDGGPVTVNDVVALAATLAGTSEDSGVIDLGPLVPGTYTTYDAVGIREDLQGKARGRSMSKRALETAEQQLNDLLNNR